MKKKINNGSYLIKDLIQGDENIVSREDFKKLDQIEIRKALNLILNEDNIDIDKVDKQFKKFAKIRIYTAGKDGSNIITDNFTLFFPGVEVDAIIDRTGAGDCYAAGFLKKLYDLIENKSKLNDLFATRTRLKVL